MRRKFDILRQTRSIENQEANFPPSLTDLSPVLSIAEILRNPECLLQKQRTMHYDEDNCDIYPEDSFGNDVQDVLQPFPAINKKHPAGDLLNEGTQTLPDMPRAEDNTNSAKNDTKNDESK